MPRPRPDSRGLLPAAVALAMLAACASGPRGTPDGQATLQSLVGREVQVARDAGIQAGEDKTIAAYRDFLATAPNAQQRAEAMRRLGDLEMDKADTQLASGDGAATASGNADYRAAIAHYQDYLAAYPGVPRNDYVLYQLARAQDEGGDPDAALRTLDRLVAEYPKTFYFDEVQFRRGELLFSSRDYAKAEAAYTLVLGGDLGNPYRERALYMQGWSLFKQGRLEDALHSFFGLLDRKLAGAGDDPDHIKGLSSADRELVEDTFRVTSLSLASLRGAESIPPYIAASHLRPAYEFRVYRHLAELYLKQDRRKDAADTLALFVQRHPLHAQAPVLQARVIQIHQSAGFSTLALAARKDYVSRYGAGSELRRTDPQGWERAQALVKTHLAELARHHHASAQKGKSSADYQEAARWYRASLAAYPQDPQAAQNNFLLAEVLFEDQRYGEAAAEYEKTAYRYAPHAKSADAGYAALLGHAEQEKRAAPAERAALQRTIVDSALRFAERFRADPRAAAVLTDAAEKLYAWGQHDEAAKLAQRVLASAPAAPARAVAGTVLAHIAFDRRAYAEAERGYGEVLVALPAQDARRAELVERQAASVYQQGEQARAAGQSREAVRHFERVATVAPQSALRATAQYDAAAVLIGLQDWDGAARSLEDFRQRYPKHPLQGEVGAKLATAYLEQARWTQAAGEFERIAAAAGQEPAVARAALWRAAELHEKAAELNGAPRAAAAKVYERYLEQYPEPLESALEARFALARLARADGKPAREAALMKEILLGDQRGGAARTARTRYLGATAALAQAEPALAEYRRVALVEPLDQQLKLKKARFEAVLQAYAAAADHGAGDIIVTATTHDTAALYQDFGKAMLGSQRPKNLAKAELEQYDVLLEEQAFAFEEKAIELHEANARRARLGIYDAWVKRSFAALAALRPVRYGKSERSEAAIDAIR